MMMVVVCYFPSRYLSKPWIACLSNSAQLYQTHLSLFSLSLYVCMCVELIKRESGMQSKAEDI